MPFHLELASQGHLFPSHKAIVVNITLSGVYA